VQRRQALVIICLIGLILAQALPSIIFDMCLDDYEPNPIYVGNDCEEFYRWIEQKGDEGFEVK